MRFLSTYALIRMTAAPKEHTHYAPNDKEHERRPSLVPFMILFWGLALAIIWWKWL